MSCQDLISVIVPIYGVENYLARCIDSILAQTYRELQIILVDDGSLDGCPGICDSYAKKDERIQVIHKINGGLSDARNAGLEVANGKWIAFVDSDDVLDAKFIESLYQAAVKTQSKIAICGFEEFDEELPKQKRLAECTPTVFTGAQMLERIYSDNHYEYLESVVAWNKLYHSDLFANVRFPVGKIHEDEATTYKLFFAAERVVLVKTPLYYYFQNRSGIMKRKFNVKRLDYIDALFERYMFYEEKKLPELAQKTAEKLYIFIVDYASLNHDAVENYDVFIKELKKKYRKIRPILMKAKFGWKDYIRIFVSSIYFGALTVEI